MLGWVALELVAYGLLAGAFRAASRSRVDTGLGLSVLALGGSLTLTTGPPPFGDAGWIGAGVAESAAALLAVAWLADWLDPR